MHVGRLGLIGALALLVLSVLAPANAAEPVDGFLRSETPVDLSGDLSHSGSDHTVWVQGVDQVEPPELHLDADRLRVTAVTLEIRVVQTPDPLNLSASAPPENVTRTSTTIENATLELANLEASSDLLLYPNGRSPLVTEAVKEETTARIDIAPEGMLLKDGYREHYNDSGPASEEFDWKHELEGPLLDLRAGPTFNMTGSPLGYVWDTEVTLRNETGTHETYETGRSVETGQGGATEKHRYTYLLFEAESGHVRIPTEQLRVRLFADALSFDLEGEANFPSARGALTTEEGSYHASNAQPTTLKGDVLMDLTPDARSEGELALASINGKIQSTSLVFQADEARDRGADTVVAAAGGITVLGIGLWLLWSGKGLSLAALPIVGRRVQDNQARAGPAVDVDEAKELLFDPDRFALYHLVRARPGLSGQTCRETTGIEDANQQLDLLVEHGLLELVAEEPRRYILPGSLSTDVRDDIVLLRQSRVQRVAEMLAVHGLTTQTRLYERLSSTSDSIGREEASRIVEQLVERGLAYRERGEEGIVVDSTEQLLERLDCMGESSVPRVS